MEETFDAKALNCRIYCKIDKTQIYVYVLTSNLLANITPILALFGYLGLTALYFTTFAIYGLHLDFTDICLRISMYQ